MTKKNLTAILFVILLAVSVQRVEAYNLNLDVTGTGYLRYSYPVVLGDDSSESESHQEDKPEQKQETEQKQEQQKEQEKEEVKVINPEKIEVKTEDSKTSVTLSREKSGSQELKPQNLNLKFNAAPKVTPTRKPVESEADQQEVEDTEKVMEQRTERENEKVQIQSEVHDDGTIEIQVESRNVKAKIKDSEIELDLKTNNIGATDVNGNQIQLIHLPDQALQKFNDLGVTTTPDTLEIGKSGDSFEYTVDSVKIQKLFGLFPRLEKFKLTLNDSTGTVEQQSQASNILESILNLFSF